MVRNLVTSFPGAAFVAAFLGLAWAALATTVLATYGLALFVVMPFAVGYVAALLHRATSVWRSAAVGAVATFLTGVQLLAVSGEGFVCVVMALPLAVPLAIAGAALGGSRRRGPSARSFGAVALAVPALLGAEAGAGREPVVRPVTTSIVVDAPPSAVWRHVVEFPPLPAPREAVFRAGIAYPTSATIEGRGVGAVRRCRFSTGDFVEPITVWDAPRRLAFTVSEQPPPMRERSPWGEIHPPHLDGFLVSHRGEFRLRPLPGGRTLLEGTTWYSNRMWPERYWRAWSDGLIHAIHRRVLRHVAAQAQRERPRALTRAARAERLRPWPPTPTPRRSSASTGRSARATPRR
jgi:hypothetical protein